MYRYELKKLTKEQLIEAYLKLQQSYNDYILNQGMKSIASMSQARRMAIQRTAGLGGK